MYGLSENESMSTTINIVSSADTFVTVNYPIRNFGVTTTHIDKALLRFDLSSIPTGMTCESATLKLYKGSAAGTLRARVANLYKISDANGDWIEGTKNNATALEGEPCWNAKEADGSGGVKVAWAGSEGLSTAGTDYLGTALAPQITTERSDELGTEYTFTFNATGLSVLEEWFGNATNNGFLVVETGAVNFCLREHATEAYRPVLSVTYTSGGLLKSNMNAGMQNLSGGMRG